MSNENDFKSNSSRSKIEQVNCNLVDLNEIKETKIDMELTEKFLETTYTQLDAHDDDLIRDCLHYTRKYYKPSRKCFSNYFFERFPFFKWIQEYHFKQDLVKDIIAGLTVNIDRINHHLFNLI